MNEIKKQETGITAAQIETLTQAGVLPPNVPKPIIEIFMSVCNRTKLSPFLKQIYLVGYYSKTEGKTIYSNIVGIDGMRAKAQETELFAGVDEPKFDLMPDGSYKTAAQLKAAKQEPVSCTITVYKMVGNYRCPFTKTVLFAEYCPENRKQKWLTMPFNMIAKCAESGALHMAFALETAGLSIEEEGAAYQDITIQAAAQNPAVEIGIAPDLIPRYQDLQDGLMGLADFDSVLNYYTSQFKESDLSDNRNFVKLIFDRVSELVKNLTDLEKFFHEVKEAWRNDKELMKIISSKKQYLENAK